MLINLNIKNFAVVQSLDLDFTRGLCTITGETGAGKSIMVDAMGLILGDRADPGVIRVGSNKAEINATFELNPNSLSAQWLDDNAFDTDSCILRRVLSNDGRSRAFINGVPVTLLQMKTLGESLIDIHSQHEHQSLLKKSTHAILLDNFAQTNELAEEVRKAYQSWSSAEVALKEARTIMNAKSEHLDLLRYQLEELVELELGTTEIETLESEQKRLSAAETLLAQGKQATAIFETNEVSGGVDCLSLLTTAGALLSEMSDEDHALSDILNLIDDAKIQLTEASSSLRQYLNSVEINPQKLHEVEQRLSDIFHVARKHKLQPADLPFHQANLQTELDQFELSQSNLEKLENNLAQARAAFFELAKNLSTRRMANIDKLSGQVTRHLHDMGMQGSQFRVQLTTLDESNASATGIEDVEFLVSTNPGQTPRPLNKIASGGELSRISLAIQVATVQDTTTPTLVFDEVDVGIGGATAETVGLLLRELSESSQVICVTHQPQVAAKAHSHITAVKDTLEDHADSRFEYLDGNAKVSEIARMLGGIKLTEQTLAHAEEMLGAANKN